MAKVSSSNPRFRDRETICNDVASVLSSNLAYGTKFAVLSEVTWVWSEFEGKTKGCRYWSHGALAADKDAALVHEHVVPKTVIIAKLFALSSPTPALVKAILATLCIGVVVTREEDLRLNALGLRSAMPQGWDGDDPWARYSAASIAVTDLVAGPNNSFKPKPLRGSA